MTSAQDTDIAFFSDAAQAWDALFDDCAQATQSIDIEQYIFTDDAAGQRFLNLFIEKARQGVRVRLLLDGIGSRGMILSDRTTELRDAGGLVKFYNTLGWRKLLSPSKWLPRNHNKVMLIDNRIAHVSSAGLLQAMQGWRELHARCTGALPEDIGAYFTRIWERGGQKYHTSSISSEDPQTPYRFVVSEPRLRRGIVYRELLAQVARAQKNVYLVAPYFLPPLRLRRAMKKAARRGVDIRVITSERTDVHLADCVSRSYFPALQRKRLHLFLYHRAVLHAKYACVDGDWAMVGSTNLDYLSLLRNREANIIIRDKDAISQLEKIFHETLADCHAFDKDYWRQLPFHYKIMGYLGRMIRGIL